MNANEQRLDNAAVPVCEGEGSGTCDDVPGGEIQIGRWMWYWNDYDLDDYVYYLVQAHQRKMEAS